MGKRAKVTEPNLALGDAFFGIFGMSRKVDDGEIIWRDDEGELESSVEADDETEADAFKELMRIVEADLEEQE
jgi:hypothetical protein